MISKSNIPYCPKGGICRRALLWKKLDQNEKKNLRKIEVLRQANLLYHPCNLNDCLANGNIQ